MPRNGTGTYIAPASTWNPGVNGVTALTADFNNLLDDLEAGLTQSVSKDGQTPMAGNLAMGNNKITGLANGTATTDAAAFGQIVQIVGQCRLTLSGANLLLSPFNGNRIFVNGVLCSIPAAGVSLAPTSLAASTVYNIYAVQTAGVITSLEASTTARATDVTYGNQIKNGDATRVLVGKARTTAAVAWADSNTQRFVISWFNQTPRRIYNSLGANTPTNSLTPVGIVGQMEFVSWGDSCVPVSFVGNNANTTANQTTSTALSFDATLAFSHSPSLWSAYAGNVFGSCTGGSTFLPGEGYHFVVLNGAVSGGTGTWIAGLEMSGVIQG